ncbi:ABC transporter permease [Microbacterium sp. NPDC097977]|uniref:ABC transporter permease n=1 Tax=Microbacterium sp. NPDC097977 TaxID=3155686 RepID=UPI003330124F
MAGQLGNQARTTRRAGWFLILPAGAFAAIFFIVPLILMISTSFRDGADTYASVFTSPVYGTVFLNTIRTAVLTTIACALIGYPFAYALTRSGPGIRLVLLAVVLLPFWTSLLVRSFAWVGLLQDSGLINQALIALGLTQEPLALIRTPLGVLIGMVHVLLPYMVLPLITTMGQIDPSALRAASSLGAGPWRRFARVFLPLSMPGLLSGAILVFVLSLGFYITPALLGGVDSTMIGETIVNEVTRFGPVTASALGMVLLAGVLISLALLLGVRSLRRKEGIS